MKIRRRQKHPAEKRFMAKVRKEESCWIWEGCLNQFGYGRFVDNYRQWMAHRWSYTQFRGKIPRGKWVLHSCDNPPCVRPDHLKLGTRWENMLEMDQKGRRKGGPNAPNNRARLEALGLLDPKLPPPRRGCPHGCGKRFSEPRTHMCRGVLRVNQEPFIHPVHAQAIEEYRRLHPMARRK